jgi:hypothetical protein
MFRLNCRQAQQDYILYIESERPLNVNITPGVIAFVQDPRRVRELGLKNLVSCITLSSGETAIKIKANARSGLSKNVVFADREEETAFLMRILSK